MDGGTDFRLGKVRLDGVMAPPRVAEPRGGAWTREAVEGRIAEAMAVLPSMPSDRPREPDQVAWPAMQAEWLDRPDRDAPAARIKPQQSAIDRAEEVLGWLAWLAPRYRIAVSGVAMGVPLRRIARHPHMRCSHTQVARWQDKAVTCIVARLNGNGIWSEQIPKSA